MTTTRRTAIAVGVLFFIATASYLIGNALIRSALNDSGHLFNVTETQLRTGVLLEFADAAAVVGIGVVLFPILRRHREALALGYAGTRIIESALLLVSALFALLLVPVGQEYMREDAATAPQLQTLGTLVLGAYNLAFQLAMIALGAGSLLLCYILYEVRLVPRALSGLGVVGYLALFASGWLEIAGNDLASVLYIPGALFELVFPLWLIVKGLNEHDAIHVDRAAAVVGATRHAVEPARTHGMG
jgi:hypothetical protein